MHAGYGIIRLLSYLTRALRMYPLGTSAKQVCHQEMHTRYLALFSARVPINQRPPSDRVYLARATKPKAGV